MRRIQKNRITKQNLWDIIQSSNQPKTSISKNNLGFIIKLIIVLLTGILSFGTTLSAATVSGEMNNTKTIKTQKNTTITTKTPIIQYYKGIKGGCYTLTKNKKTGKMIKKYVNKTFCKK